MDLNLLKKKIPYQWKVQSVSKYEPKASCVAYIDARDVMNLLDEVVGADNWQDEFKMVGDKFVAGIGIRCPKTMSFPQRIDANFEAVENTEWVWKWDTGTTGDFEKEKSEFSDAFKRAGVKWGIGRFLYDLKIRSVKTNEKKMNDNHPYPVDDNGQRIWNLTEHFNKHPDAPQATETTPYGDRANMGQILEIRKLFKLLEIPYEKQLDAVTKAGASKLEELSKERANFILTKLREKRDEIDNA